MGPGKILPISGGGGGHKTEKVGNHWSKITFCPRVLKLRLSGLVCYWDNQLGTLATVETVVCSLLYQDEIGLYPN